jgi:hypothetical protein
MRPILILAVLFSVTVFGCKTSIRVPIVSSDRSVDTSELTVGQTCFVTLKSEESGSAVSYEGKIVKADRNSIRLSSPLRISRSALSPATDSESIEGNEKSGRLDSDVTIPRDEIIDFTLLSLKAPY